MDGPPLPLPGSGPAIPPTAKWRPLLVGLRAARANLLPGLGVQALMFAVVFAYYRLPITRPWFDRLGQLKASGGFLFSAISAMIAGALLPQIFVIFVRERRLPRWGDWELLLFGAVYWSCNGLSVDLFYRAQVLWFGSVATPLVLVKKALVDQFLFSPFFAFPFSVACFEWRNRGYRLEALGVIFDPQTYIRAALPTLMANWVVWIPVVTALYSLPPLLQIPLFSLALCFWSLMLTYMLARPSETY